MYKNNLLRVVNNKTTYEMTHITILTFSFIFFLIDPSI